MADERQCRFCFDNSDADEDRLFRPCLCSGTSAYVHESCLELWRESELNSANFFQCAVCHYRYRLRRVGLYHVITHWIPLSILTLVLALLLLIVDAYFIRLLAYFYDPTVVSLSPEDSFATLSPDCILLAVAMIGIMAFIVAVCAGDMAEWDFKCHGPTSCEVMFVGIVLIGFGYFIYYVYIRLRRYAHRLLKSAGNQVLEIKKLE